LAAMEAEFYHGHQNAIGAYDRLLGPQLAAANMPHCTKLMLTANERSKRFKTPCFSSIFMQLTRVIKGQEPLDNAFGVKLP
jgi:hypothetical protein